MEPLITLQDVSFSTQQEELVRRISYGFDEGKATALVGPSGGGKSTVLKLAAGLLIPRTGTVCFRGKDLADMTRGETLEFRRESAVVFQDSALWANQNLYQNLELPLRVHFPQFSKGERENRMHQVLAEVGYKKNLFIRPAQLSMGEQKLIAFARAMLCRPQLLFLDEWTESLDGKAAQRLIDLVKVHKGMGSTLIFVSHDLKLIKTLADDIVMIQGGEIAFTITGEDIAHDEYLAQHIEQGIAL
ncbi:MAG: ATP-binding cassette domain-containing protein [Treponema sp.]|jgi:ABC-type transporter Mla maintaining outer membrane lipid asymmetry ATPase subunit MlaF|nr:ATP-binding cassette domain-containing protein [Treponema sp.]